MRDRFLVILNPVSGQGRSLRRGRELAEKLRRRGVSADVRETGGPGDVRRFAAEGRDYSAVVCIGGDGTVNEALNGLPDGVPLAMVPSGTANVLAKELRLPRRSGGLARVLRKGEERKWDSGVDRVGGRRFLLFAGAGFDAHVVEVFHAVRKGTIRMWQYIWWGLKCLVEYRAPRIRVEIDGRLVAEEAAWVLVSNVSNYGGPLTFTPDARPDNGVFEVMVVRAPRRRDTPRLFFGALVTYFTGWRYPFGGVEFLPGRRIRLSSPDRVPLQLDGDPAGTLPADLELLPSSVTLLAPARKPPAPM